MPTLITILLPTQKVINGETFDCKSSYQLNLVTVKNEIEVYFWKPSENKNGKHFLTIQKKDKTRFVKACKG